METFKDTMFFSHYIIVQHTTDFKFTLHNLKESYLRVH